MEFSEDPVQLRKQNVEMYARRITMSAFQLTPDMSMDEHATRVFGRLKFDLGLYFDEIAPVSDRCHMCGKMKTEPTAELMAYQVAERRQEAYERQAYQLDAKTRTLCEQLSGANRLDMIAVCAEFLNRHVVLAAEARAEDQVTLRGQ